MIVVTVVIPTYQRRDSLREVLLTLSRADFDPARFEVIVSIDGSDDGTEEMLKGVNVPYSLHWTHGPNAGPGAARNRGAALAQGDFLLFLDDDILATPPLLGQHLAAHPSADGRTVGLGRVETFQSTRLSSWERYLSARYDEHYEKLAQPGYQLTFWDCLSGSLSMPRALFEWSGGFDASFAAAKHDDIEFGYRLARMDAEFIYQPDALAYHRFVKSIDAGLHDAWVDGQSTRQLAEQYPELRQTLITERRAHYRGLAAPLLRWATASSVRHARLLALGERWLRRVNWLPLIISRPFCQLAYHLHFWQGVQTKT